MLEKLSNYAATDSSLWQGRQDSLPAERFFQRVHLLDLQKTSLTSTRQGIVLLGFLCDEGIRRNQGRVGAKLGPFALRQQLGKFACHNNKQFVDVGNILCEGQELERAHHAFANLIHYCQAQGYKTVAFGGGHEIAWGHFLGLTNHYPELGIINFDAHFDIRPLNEKQMATSGTPFRQIAEHSQKQGKKFNYCCIGIQESGNTQSLFSSAKELNVTYLRAEQIHSGNLAEQIAFLDKFISTQQAIYLTFCLDVLAESYAPGVSAPQALGLTPGQILPLLKYIVQTGKVVGLDIAELSPPFDREHQTARLAANIVAELLNYF